MLALLAPQLSAGHQLLSNVGNYKFSGDSYKVEISITEVSKNHIKPLISFNEGKSSYTTGYGDKNGLLIIPQKWVAQFQAPNKLWVYDGAELILLYKRTPTGFKAYDNEVVKNLISDAPEEFKKVVLGSYPQQN
ncbi:hypothetical protein [Rubritalea sp.]|uniref:hypothetical protein n=1 Tax=Rubritalea sp. TaxID=2109375 RepID=UPI003EF46B16